MNTLVAYVRSHTQFAARLLLAFASLIAVNAAQAGAYEAEVAKWKSHEDVAQWLKANFSFDKGRLAFVQRQLREAGVENVPTRRAENLFSQHSGYCRDSAGFARDALNRIDSRYEAQYIFIKNKLNPTNHWVTGFKRDGKLYVMDYGAGDHWAPMMGVHGPYDSLDDYMTFLASLRLKGFEPEYVKWRDIPGQED